jgi:ATP-dependent DNA helicase UvrD/PcrA
VKFIADFHIHSKFSRATARNADLENLYVAAQLKGITLIGTGDFTHPGWFSELEEKLVPAEPGLFRLKDDLADAGDLNVPDRCRSPVRFILTAEISNIYKKDGRTRKNHNLVFVPDMEAARIFRERLDRIGNIRSDGRPILGLDARVLLDILLELDERNFLIPAHIWTPWFSLLGSKSGFDAIEECFEDLSPYIFALETGLSSDPAMNRRVSALDGRTLVSNSDAHSPAKLGREANLFNTDLSYTAVRTALETGDTEKFLGTLEFFPEEGKYHLDGHRKCGICFRPEETQSAGGICPVCGKPLTLGVMYRVEELADRPAERIPDLTHPFYGILPLTDILSDIYRVGPGSKKVAGAWQKALSCLGSELTILRHMDIDRLDQAGIPLLGEAVHRMRCGRIHLNGGFDGQYGTVNIFTDDEHRRLMGQKSLFIMPEQTAPPMATASKPFKKMVKIPKKKMICRSGLNPEQTRAVAHGNGPLMIIAGPGTGKTLTLTRRIAHLMKERNVSPGRILAVTFTNKAAREMMDRLDRFIADLKERPFISTFHGFCLSLLKEQMPEIIVIDEPDRKSLLADAMDLVLESGDPVGGSAKTNLARIIDAKQRLLTPEDDLGPVTPDAHKNGFKRVYAAYESILMQQGLLDFEDLIFKVVQRLASDPVFLESCIQRFTHIFVDEYQDLNFGQYRLIRTLAPGTRHDLFVIGDPNQAIYGFRGSNTRYFNQFIIDYPEADVIRLIRNYRSTKPILDAADQVIRSQHTDSEYRICAQSDGGERVMVMAVETESGEAVIIGKTIETLVGGLGMHAMDFGKIGDNGQQDRFSFSDFAVLARTRAQLDVMADQFDSAGIPFQMGARDHFFNQRGVAEVLSLLKIVSGRGIFADIDRIRGLVRPGISRDSAGCFKRWCIRNHITINDARFKVREFPVPGLTQKRQQRLYDFLGALFSLHQAVKGLTVAEKIQYLIQHTKVVEALPETSQPALDRLTKMAAGAGRDIRKWMADIALSKDPDTLVPGVEKVSLLTIHAAKGLEFKVVFISGCEEGLIPYCRDGQNCLDEAEERRLFYVALTRAEKALYLTRARRRTFRGRRQRRPRSPFLAVMENVKEHEESRPVKWMQDPGQVQMKLF